MNAGIHKAMSITDDLAEARVIAALDYSTGPQRARTGRASFVGLPKSFAKRAGLAEAVALKAMERLRTKRLVTLVQFRREDDEARMIGVCLHPRARAALKVAAA